MSTLLHYRGCYGSIETCPEEGCLFGKSQFIQALVSYEGGSLVELSGSFREAVDD